MSEPSLQIETFERDGQRCVGVYLLRGDRRKQLFDGPVCEILHKEDSAIMRNVTIEETIERCCESMCEYCDKGVGFSQWHVHSVYSKWDDQHHDILCQAWRIRDAKIGVTT